jgi:hypothetical protein
MATIVALVWNTKVVAADLVQDGIDCVRAIQKNARGLDDPSSFAPKRHWSVDDEN